MLAQIRIGARRLSNRKWSSYDATNLRGSTSCELWTTLTPYCGKSRWFRTFHQWFRHALCNFIKTWSDYILFNDFVFLSEITKYITKPEPQFKIKFFKNDVNQYLQCRVIGACEVAAYFLKHQHGIKIEMSKMSRIIKNVNLEDSRLRCYDTKNDDYYPDLIVHFNHLPSHLKQLTLRQFVEQYDVHNTVGKPKPKSKKW